MLYMPLRTLQMMKVPSKQFFKNSGEKKGRPKKCLVFSSGGKVTNLTIEFS
jgi:hypothetical protein